MNANSDGDFNFNLGNFENVILSRDRKYLECLLLKLHEFLNGRLRITLHEHKVCIQTYASGVDFLGWVHFPHHRQIRTTTKNKIIRKMRGYPKGQIVNSYRGVFKHGNTYKVQKRLGLHLPDYGDVIR